MLSVKALECAQGGNNSTFLAGLFVFILINIPLTFADDSCHLRHIQCADPVFSDCSQGRGEGQCINTAGTGIVNETCSAVVFRDGDSGSYRDRPFTCKESDGCEAVACPEGCANNQTLGCNCVAVWGLTDISWDSGLISFEPGFCIPGSIDGSCHQQFFKCDTVNFNFCYKGYGSGLCINKDSPGRNCTINYYPYQFRNTVDGQHIGCDHETGCESITCSDGCHGTWHINNVTKVAPGNCAANRGKPCQLDHLNCNNTYFSWCEEGFGKGYCHNPVSGENCTMMVMPDHHFKRCSYPDGCESLSCPSCQAQWMVNNRTTIWPRGCVTGSNDGSCQLRFFECSSLDLEFCEAGYGLGRCHNDLQKTGCTIWFTPDNRSFVDSHGVIFNRCHQSSGCEWLNCENGCKGHGYAGWQETSPGNCLPTAGKPCQLQYFSCDDQQFDHCAGGYGTGTCNNANTVETCSITVYPKGWRKSPDDPVLCNNDQGCEEVECPENCGDVCDCAGQWNVYGKTNTYPPGCIDHRPTNSNSDKDLTIGLGITSGVVLLAAATGITITAVACVYRYTRRITYQTIAPTH